MILSGSIFLESKLLTVQSIPAVFDLDSTCGRHTREANHFCRPMSSHVTHFRHNAGHSRISVEGEQNFLVKAGLALAEHRNKVSCDGVARCRKGNPMLVPKVAHKREK